VARIKDPDNSALGHEGGGVQLRRVGMGWGTVLQLLVTKTERGTDLNCNKAKRRKRKKLGSSPGVSNLGRHKENGLRIVAVHDG